MRKIIFSALLLLAVDICHAAMTGGEGVGGGDLCEDRVQEVRDDIKSWIDRGGPNGLKLPQGVTTNQYSQKMLAALANAKIDCVGLGDPGFPVAIDGTPKVCVFSSSAKGSQITCDYAKFQAMNASDQYVLVHHEFAGIATLEVPNGDVSSYSISNQISGFLTTVEVQKLAVRPPTPPSPSSTAIAAIGDACPFNASKQNAAIKTVLADILRQAGLPFPIKANSLSVNCKKLAEAHNPNGNWWLGPDYFLACATTFSAQDGTAFVITGDDASYLDTYYYNYTTSWGPDFDGYLAVPGFFSQQNTDNEGNGAGPISCVSSFGHMGSFRIKNKKSGVEIYVYVVPGVNDETDPHFSYPR